MTTLSSLTRTLSAVAVIAATFAAQSAHAEPTTAKAVRAAAGMSFDVGQKHAVGYYLAQDGGCNLTLLVGDAGVEVASAKVGTVPARFNTYIPAGRSARIDTGEGPSVEFVCANGASSLSARVIERLAYVAPAK